MRFNRSSEKHKIWTISLIYLIFLHAHTRYIAKYRRIFIIKIVIFISFDKFQAPICQKLNFFFHVISERMSTAPWQFVHASSRVSSGDSVTCTRIGRLTFNLPPVISWHFISAIASLTRATRELIVRGSIADARHFG